MGRGRLVDDGMTRHRRTYGIEARSRGGPHGGALPATVPGFIVQIYAHCSVKQKADPEANGDTDQYVSTPLGLGGQPSRKPVRNSSVCKSGYYGGPEVAGHSKPYSLYWVLVILTRAQVSG